MKKRLAAAALLIALCVSLCACGNVYDREYLAVSTYTPTLAEDETEEGGVSVRTLADLRKTIRSFVVDGQSSGRIVFDPNYEGDVNEDMASACWQVRTQDALCAYCVDNLSYELSKIVSYYEAEVSITYTEAGRDQSAIVRMQYSTGLNERLRSCMQQGNEQLVLLIQRSSFSAEEIVRLASAVYCESPLIAPAEPVVTVNMFSGTGTQRLYEINFDYTMDADTLAQRREELAALDPFADTDVAALSEIDRAYLACRYLAEHCASRNYAVSTVYDALIRHESNSVGMALAYVALCEKLGLNCIVVDGQRNWQDHTWNIVRVNGSYYHVDAAVCAEQGIEAGFLLDDELAWVNYRWDVSAYPRCMGTLGFEDVTAPAVEEAADETETQP